MRTESDLLTAIDHLADQAPTAAELLAELDLNSTRHRRSARLARRSYLLPAVAATAVVLLAAGVAVVGTSGADDHGQTQATAQGGGGPSVAHPCATGGRLDLFGITMRHVDGIADGATYETSCSGVTQRVLQSSTGKPAGAVEVFRPDVFDTSKLTGSTPISGSGMSGFLLPHGSTAMLDVDNPEPTANSVITCVRASDRLLVRTRGGHIVYGTNPGPSSGPSGAVSGAMGTGCPESRILAWRYAPDSWAVVGTPATSARSSETTQLLSLASAVDTAHPTTVHMPFSADSLPAGIRIVDSYISSTAHGTVIHASVGLGVTGRPGCPTDTACESFGEISVTPTSTHTQKLTGTPVTINDHTGYLLDQGEQRPDIELAFLAQPWRVLVGQGSDRQVTDSTLLTIARSLRFAPNTTDPSTWFNVNTAFQN